MRLVVNGLERHFSKGLTVAMLLEAENEPVDHVLVEVNGVYLPADRYGQQILADGDRVEIIHPAFGG